MKFEPCSETNYCSLKKYEYYNYNDMENILEEKYNFELRSYHKFKFTEINETTPYMDFWHFIVDDYFGDICDGVLCHLNWQEVYDIAKEEWQREIATCFIKEFGTQDFMVHIY